MGIQTRRKKVIVEMKNVLKILEQIQTIKQVIVDRETFLNYWLKLD